MKNNLQFKFIKPDKPIVNFVNSFSSLQNISALSEGVIIPNGKIDLIFFKTTDDRFQVSLMGLETKPKAVPKKMGISTFFAISFEPLAVEYILHHPVADILNSGKLLPNNFWDFSAGDLDDFDAFCKKAQQKISSLIPGKIDERKRKLFELMFETNGELSIEELSDNIGWSKRQMNRYFNQYFGLSLKAYCNILRFQASLPDIKQGKLFPQLNFSDQSHFIKEIKKLSGVSPKELFKNENDRFLQFLVNDAS